MIAGAIGKKWPFLVASVVALVVWGKTMFPYFRQYSTMSYDALYYRLNFENGDVAIGTWLSLVIILAAFIISLVSKVNSKDSPTE